MFFSELSPLVREFVHKPIAFAGGFVSGILRLDLNEQPVRQWLEQQVGAAPESTTTETQNGGNGNGPQSIAIE